MGSRSALAVKMGQMSDQAEEFPDELDDEEGQPVVAGVTITYLGPVAPHWDLRTEFGEPDLVNSFRSRVNARLMLLPPHDPQFRRNRERVDRDAEREFIEVYWDLGDADPANR